MTPKGKPWLRVSKRPMLGTERLGLMGILSMRELSLTEAQKADIAGNAMCGWMIIFLLVAWRATISV